MVAGVAVAMFALVAAVLSVHGTGQAGVLELVRWTARPSLVLLCLALAADGLRFVVTRRRFAELLRGLAVAHLVHAGAVGALAIQLDGRNLVERANPVTVVGGLLAYVFIVWGALRPESRLVPFGLAWIWAVFLVTYWGRAVRSPVPFAAPVVLLALAMAVRLGGFVRSRRLQAT